MSNTVPCACPCPTPETINTPGVQGQSAFTDTAANFVVPALGNSVTVQFVNTDWMAVGQSIFIQGAGIFTVTNIVDSTHATINYTNITTNTASGNTIASGSQTSPGGTPGADGSGGGNAFTLTTANFVVPAVSANVTVQVASSSWMTPGQTIFIQNAGYFLVVSKADTTHATLTYQDVSSNTNTGNTVNSGAAVSPAGAPLANPLTVSRGGTSSTTPTAARAALGAGGASLTVYASGTVYSLTATPAEAVFGTTSPSLTINAVGTWLIFARARVDYNAATFAANQTGALKLRRTNNTAADLTSATAGFKTDITTTKTFTLADIVMPPVVYVTTNTNDIIQLWGSISVIPGAGSLDIVEAEIIAIKLFDQTL